MFLIKSFRYIFIILINLFVIEIGCFFIGMYLIKIGVFYSPPSVNSDEYKKYLESRDKVLGWSPTLESKSSSNYSKEKRFDKVGSRFVPVFPDPDKFKSCVSLYGDSFTYASEVDAEHAWGNVLSKLLNCRVANYGVEGYGTDQAYLRFRINKQDKSKIVILGFLTENIIRNVNQYRRLLQGDKFTLKPRFILTNDGKLELISLPDLTYEEFMDWINNPESYFEYEYFVPEGNSGIIRFKFPFTISILRSFKNYRIQCFFYRGPNYAQFYNMDHHSKAIHVTDDIIRQFHSLAIKRQVRPIILIMPTRYELEYFARNGKWTYSNLIRLLNEDKLEIIDAGPLIINKLKSNNFNSIFAKHYHLNENGNELLAEIIYEHLKYDVAPHCFKVSAGSETLPLSRRP